MSGNATRPPHARVVRALRDLADRIEAMSESSLREALPIAAGGIDELVRRLAPRLQ